MRWLPLTAALAATTGPLTAQDRTVRMDVEGIFNDGGYIVRAPMRASAGDWRTAGLVAGGFGLLLLADEPVFDWLRASPGSLPARLLEPFGESSPVSLTGRTAQFLVPLSAVLYAAGHVFDSHDLKDAGIGCFTSNLTTTLTRVGVSLMIGRLRPRYDGGAFTFEALGGMSGWDMRSFPGGHAANVMSCASYFNNRFDPGAAEPVIWATAAGVGLARITDEAHWSSDTFAGMAYGYAVGRGVAGRFRARADARERSLQPTLRLGYRITF